MDTQTTTVGIIIGRFTITADRRQWILTESNPVSHVYGTVNSRPKESYYATLQQCCQAIVQRDAGASTSVSGDANAVIEAIARSTAQIALACAGIKRPCG